VVRTVRTVRTVWTVRTMMQTTHVVTDLRETKDAGERIEMEHHQRVVVPEEGF
jgi:hypothetical protein